MLQQLDGVEKSQNQISRYKKRTSKRRPNDPAASPAIRRCCAMPLTGRNELERFVEK
jgi:hypothetical protein